MMTKEVAIEIVKRAKITCTLQPENILKKESVFLEYAEDSIRIGLIEIFRLHSDKTDTKCIAGVQKAYQNTLQQIDFETILAAVLFLRESIGEKTIYDHFMQFSN